MDSVWLSASALTTCMDHSGRERLDCMDSADKHTLEEDFVHMHCFRLASDHHIPVVHFEVDHFVVLGLYLAVDERFGVHLVAVVRLDSRSRVVVH